jgi:hypothetical protein
MLIGAQRIDYIAQRAPPEEKPVRKKWTKKAQEVEKTKDLLKKDLEDETKQWKGFYQPDEKDYAKWVRKFSKKATFASLWQCFQFCDPYGKGIIDDKDIFAELVSNQGFDISIDDAWENLDDDGNSAISFPEFVQWINSSEQVPEVLRFLPVGGAKEQEEELSHIHCVPCYWEGGADLGETKFFDCGIEVIDAVQRIVNKSYMPTWTRDRKEGNVPEGMRVVGVKRVENIKIWRKYTLKRALMRAEIGDQRDLFQKHFVKTDLNVHIPFMGIDNLECGSLNEWFLWHGTSKEGAISICGTDFKQKLAGSATGTLYGPGTYFAESITKADEYAKPDEEGIHTVLLNRILGGVVQYTDVE